MLKLKLQYFGHLMRRTDSLEKILMLGKIQGGRRRDDRGWNGWMASPTQWTWVLVSSGSWWWTVRPGVLQSMGSQRVRLDWGTELNYLNKLESMSSKASQSADTRLWWRKVQHLFAGCHLQGFPGGSGSKESASHVGDLGSIPGLGRPRGGGHGNLLLCSCLENPHGQRSLAGCCPWDRKELDSTEPLNTSKEAQSMENRQLILSRPELPDGFQGGAFRGSIWGEGCRARISSDRLAVR